MVQTFMLGKNPLFKVGGIVKQRSASYGDIGFFDSSIVDSETALKVVSIHHQVMIGLPVMDLVWEYLVIEIPVCAKSQCFYLLEPQLFACGFPQSIQGNSKD